MAFRKSRLEKGKWIPDPRREVKRPPIEIPQVNTAALIEENKLTLIGRVTNPKIQKTRALVDFFLQQWRVSGTITGRDLGPNLFQFKFESEQDLQEILSKAPLHFKRWMLILQRWEPIVSDFFPALIPFWITVHGLPLHYWTHAALEIIGEELGPVEKYDVPKGRIRVLINGLKPLEMKLDVSLSGEIKQVELEYEDLGKHCFICFSLTHDKDDCPSQRAQANYREQGPRMGISQTRTLERIESERRKADERRRARSNSNQWQRQATREFDWKNDKDFRYNYGARRDPNFRENTARQIPPGPSNRRPARDRLSFSKEGDETSSKVSQSRQQTPRSEWRPVASKSGGHSKEALSLVSHTPSPRPHREGGSSILGGISASRQVSGGGSVPSQERRSALHRLSLSSERIPILQDGRPNEESGRLQDAPTQVLEQNNGNKSVPSSSRNLVSAAGTPYDISQDRSPIRTLSEDRVHVSLRLGPLFTSEDDDSLNLRLPTNVPKASSRSTAGRNSENAATASRKRSQRSSGQGTPVKKRRTTKVIPSPRRRQGKEVGSKTMDTSKEAGTAQPKIPQIPATKKKGTDFRSAPKPLP
ncbi:hypothetical protein Bca101_053310 [Brassica carinata]